MTRSTPERDVVVIEFPGAGGFPLGAIREILSLAEAEIVKVDQVAVVRRRHDGRLESPPGSPLDDVGDPLSAFRDCDQLRVPWDVVSELCASLTPGRYAALFVLEQTWAEGLHDEVDASACRVIARQPFRDPFTVTTARR